MYLMQGVRKTFSDETFEKRSVQVSGKEHPSQRELQVQRPRDWESVAHSIKSVWLKPCSLFVTNFTSGFTTLHLSLT